MVRKHWRDDLHYHSNQLISNKEMSIASASTDAMRAKGADFFYRFWASHADEVTAYQNLLTQDATNFSAFGSERRHLMLREHALGVVYLSSLPDNEKASVLAIAQRQYQQNTQIIFPLLTGGGVILGLLVAFFTLSESKENDFQQSSSPARFEISRLT